MTSINMLIVKWREKPNAQRVLLSHALKGTKCMTNQEDVRCVAYLGPDTKEKTAEKSCCGTKGIG
jgi:hypothetical protein